LIFFAALFARPGAAQMVGDADTRVYVDDIWSQYPFNLIVKLKSADGSEPRGGDAFCTGQYVGRDLILTAAHCVKYGTGGKVRIESHKGEWTASLVDMGPFALSGAEADPNDYALYRIDDRAGHLKLFSSDPPPFRIEPASHTQTGVSLAGFGGLRRISDMELEQIRRILIALVEQDMRERINSGKSGPLVQMEDVMVSHGSSFANRLERELAIRGIRNIYGDTARLKWSPNCAITSVDANWVGHNCDASQGNSGGAIFYAKQGGYYILGIVSNGKSSFGRDAADGVHSYATKPEKFYGKVQDFATWDLSAFEANEEHDKLARIRFIDGVYESVVKSCDKKKEPADVYEKCVVDGMRFLCNSNGRYADLPRCRDLMKK